MDHSSKIITFYFSIRYFLIETLFKPPLAIMLVIIAIAVFRPVPPSPKKRKHCYRYPIRVKKRKPKTSISRDLLKQIKKHKQLKALYLDILTTQEIAMYGL